MTYMAVQKIMDNGKCVSKVNNMLLALSTPNFAKFQSSIRLHRMHAFHR